MSCNLVQLLKILPIKGTPGNYFISIFNNHIAHFRLIRPGRLIDGQVEVLSGLKSGDRFITSPAQNIVDGVKVEES